MARLPLPALLAFSLAVAAACLPVATVASAQGPAGGPKTQGDDGKEDRPGLPAAGEVAPDRFGPMVDEAYGAYQRGLYITALNLAMKRAEKGDSAAQTLAAEIYSRGLGVARDPKKAAELYGKAAAQGDPAAEFQYALILLDGTIVPKDVERAYDLMKAAADSGNHLAEFNLAQMILNGQASGGISQAVTYFERAADAGVADAQYAMAEIYANGVGSKRQDDAQARTWLQKAARANYDTAQLELGTWLIDGRGGKADPKAGFAWLKRAAEAGNVAAQNRLAKLYVAGIGTDGNPVDAAAWYILAHRAGLVDPDMEDFMNGLTDDQRKQAIERANRLR